MYYRFWSHVICDYSLFFESNSLSISFFLKGYIGFFGSLAKRDPDHWLGSKSDGRFKNVLSDAVDNNAISISMVAFESISWIATTPTGRITLDKLFGEYD